MGPAVVRRGIMVVKMQTGLPHHYFPEICPFSIFFFVSLFFIL
jgi:hypothetical protein